MNLTRILIVMIADSSSPAEQYLRAWHSRNPDASRVFAHARDRTGRSSYQRLAMLATDATAILDVACGTGALLSMIRQTAAPPAELFGIDIARSELDLAAKRPIEARLVVARAQALPFSAGSVDLVICHMALMLLDRPDQALEECRRVLRTGGRFSAIVNRSSPPDAVAKSVLAALRPAWERAGASKRPPPLGDARTVESAALKSLVRSCFDEVSVDEFDVVQQISLNDLWPFLVDALYGMDAIDEADARACLEAAGLSDPVSWTIPMIQVSARA